MPRIETLLKNKSARQKANIKAKEIAKIKSSKKRTAFSGSEYDIEIISSRAIEGGVEILAKAWDIQGNPIGFGKDGSVEIERFNIYNPPVLVDDPKGIIIRNWTDKDGNKKERKLREDPKEALRQTLVHTIKVVAKDGSNIVKGKIGNTTSTFYPDANPESTSVDGRTFVNTAQTTWTTIVNHAGNNATDNDTNTQVVGFFAGASTNQWTVNIRGIFLFDTASLPDTDSIDSATLSLFSLTSGTDPDSNAPTINIYSSTPASNTSLTSADYSAVGSTAFSSDVTFASWDGSSAYNDFSLNSSGLSDISKTGVSKFSARESTYDVPDSAPTWGSNSQTEMFGYIADETGTSKDPKLVVTHSAAPTFIPKIIMS